MTFVIMPASGISQGIQPILGNNYGPGRFQRVMDTFYQATALSVGITCVIWVIVLLFPQQILAAFGGTEDMFAIGITGLRLNFCITPVLGFVMLATTFFQSINRPIPSILISLLRQVVFFGTVFICIAPVDGHQRHLCGAAHQRLAGNGFVAGAHYQGKTPDDGVSCFHW